MHKFAIRILVLAMFGTASAGVAMVTPAKAATDGHSTVKKKHKRMIHAGSEAQPPRTSSQYPTNMSDDPSRKVSY